MNAEANNPARAGQNASYGQKLIFGYRARYAVYAVHTRFDSVAWFVEDAEQEDELTGGLLIVRISDSFSDAIDGLDNEDDDWD